MTRGRIIFTGNFFEFAIIFILLFIISIFTLGFGFAYLAYWSVKYFVANLEIELYDQQS
jgi:hypothetical protein